jgi:hypothetical protein
VQWIKRKSIAKVDGDILILGGFYIVTLGAYLLFESYVVNYRPVLIAGFLEASYPSSTTLLVMCVMPTAAMQLGRRIQKPVSRRVVTAGIAAFVVFPENFVENALYGDVGQLRFVCTMGASGLVSIIKEEVTGIVDSILVACQQGSYGVGDALTENDFDHLWGHHVNGLALEYVDFLFDRSKMYQVESLTQEHFVPFDRYMLGGLTVLLLMLGCLPFAPLYIRTDPSLARLLRAKGIGVAKQVASEYAGFCVALSVLLAAVCVVMDFAGMLPEASLWKVFFGALPTLVMVSAFAYLLFTLSGNLIGGVLMTFVAILALSFAGGCMYPVQVFPLSMQQLAQVLPSGMARMEITALVQGGSGSYCLGLLCYGGCFLLLSTLVSGYKAGKVRG